MDTGNLLLVCLLSALPGPPGMSVDDAYVQLYPVDKTKCPTIDPVRDISYELYTSENPTDPDMLRIDDDDALKNSHMDFNRPTMLFFHAFFESSTSLTATTIRTAYLQRKDHNIIILNAPRMEAGPWYLTAARNTRVVGEYTARFIDYLVSRGLFLPSLHLIGLSLGAQMAGVCGQNVRSGRIRRITGLDPAGPLFTKWPRNLKLDQGDAEFVDVIHTDAGIFGYPRSIGHVDFWPNQGISPQPGCTFGEVKRRNPDGVLEKFFCSHWRSYMFFAESVVTPNSFESINCKNWPSFIKNQCNETQRVNMGFNVDSNARGNFYLTTRRTSPFSLQTPLPQAQMKRPPPVDVTYIEQPQYFNQENEIGNYQYEQPQPIHVEQYYQPPNAHEYSEQQQQQYAPQPQQYVGYEPQQELAYLPEPRHEAPPPVQPAVSIIENYVYHSTPQLRRNKVRMVSQQSIDNNLAYEAQQEVANVPETSQPQPQPQPQSAAFIEHHARSHSRRNKVSQQSIDNNIAHVPQQQNVAFVPETSQLQSAASRKHDATPHSRRNKARTVKVPQSNVNNVAYEQQQQQLAYVPEAPSLQPADSIEQHATPNSRQNHIKTQSSNDNNVFGAKIKPHERVVQYYFYQ